MLINSNSKHLGLRNQFWSLYNPHKQENLFSISCQENDNIFVFGTEQLTLAKKGNL